MKPNSLTKLLASFFLTLILAPTAYFFVVPAQPARAFDFGAGSWATFGETVLQYAQMVLSYVRQGLQWVLQQMTWVNEYILQPLATILSGNMLKKMTANMILNVTDGASNGTNQAQFVQDLRGQLRQVGDTQTLSFLNQFEANSNSPFKSSIKYSVASKYDQNTSAAGFFGANKDTFVSVTGSPANADAFLSGNWSKGGVAAWFALTTEDNNNPYLLQQASQRQANDLVGEAQDAAVTTLNWGQGFRSYCGKATPDDQQTGTVGTAVGDTCTKSDGTPNNDDNVGVIKTPGTVIKASLDKALALPAEKITNLGGGKVSSEIINALQDVQTVLMTINLAKELLGSKDQDKGLIGSAGTVSTYASATGYLGVTTDQVRAGTPNFNNLDPNGTQSTGAQDMATRLPKYESAWGLIRNSADYTSTNLTNFENSCPSQAAQAQTALSTTVTPVLTQADAADAIAAAAEALLQQVQSETSSSASYANDIKTLQSMQPTDTDTTNAQQDTLSTGAATATPPGSLNVSGGTIIDRLALINANIAALLASASCP